MKTKLTLVMEDEVIYKAKQYAKKKEESLSSLVEHYLRAVALGQEIESGKNVNLTRIKSPIGKYRGIISIPKDYNYKKEIGQYLLNKYNKLK